MNNATKAETVSWFRYSDDWFNPIVIKELRQAVQSKFVSGILLLFLVVQLFYVFIILIDKMDRESFYVGRELFSGLLYTLLFVCVFFVPLYSGIRLASEHSETNVDLLFITTLQPKNIVWGKLCAGLILTLLLFSAAMPFMTLTYLLRGIDLPSIFILLLLNFGMIAIGTQAAIFVACLPGNRIAKIFVGLICLWGIFMLFIMTIAMSDEMLRYGVGSYLESKDFWMAAPSIAMLILAAIGLLFVLALAILTPPSANRMLPVRIYMVVCWVAFGILALVLSFFKYERGMFIAMWLIGSVILGGICFLIGISEREESGTRVAKAIPRYPLKRLLVFPLYSGSANGVCFGSLIIGLSFLIHVTIYAIGNSSLWPTNRDVQIIWECSAGLALYFFCYSLSAALLRRWFFSTKVKQIHTWGLALILLAAGMILPVLIWYLLGFNLNNHDSVLAFILNPFMFIADTSMDRSYRYVYLLTLTIWGVGVFVLNLHWFMGRLKAFKPWKAPKSPATASALCTAKSPSIPQ